MICMGLEPEVAGLKAPIKYFLIPTLILVAVTGSQMLMDRVFECVPP